MSKPIYHVQQANTQFEIIYLDNYLTISDTIHHPEDAMNSNPYNTVFNLQVKSGVLSGIAECEYGIKECLRFADEIKELYEFHTSKVELDDIGYGRHVSFSMDNTGHLTISGKIYGNARIQSLEFEFSADQTSLKGFADLLELV